MKTAEITNLVAANANRSEVSAKKAEQQKTIMEGSIDRAALSGRFETTLFIESTVLPHLDSYFEEIENRGFEVSVKNRDSQARVTISWK